VVTGSGDPTLGSEYSEEKCRDFLGKWVSEIKDQKFAEQPFRLLVDDSLFGYEGVSPQWTWEDLGNYYAAGAYGVSVFDNTYQILFNTMNVDSAPLILGIEPSIPNLVIQNNLQLNTTGKDNGYIYGIPFSNDRRIYGDIPSGRTSFSIKGDIPDPGLFLANTLRDTLVSVGLMVIDCQTVRESPLQGEKLKTFYEHISPELKDIVRQINWRSNNHYAEHLIRTIGIEGQIVDRTNALKKGISRIGSFWKSKQMDTTSLVMYDGCGLSPLNAVTPEFMTDVLVEIQRGKNGKSFRESLPKAGEEGTVRNFLKGNGLEGKVWVKSGSISGVQCYAGYYMDGERKYAFTLMVNKFSGPRGVVVKNIEQLLLSLF
jgi:D-alanyl-D-alanine carboxypeptidase/D-alanyl-D-alanine-endopeptidase (penicillin-binding protein 4)